MNRGYNPKPEEIHAANISVLKERIKSGKLSGVYFFYGDEEYTKNFYYDKMREACKNTSLNVKMIDGADFELSDFYTACDTEPTAMSFDMFSGIDEDSEKKNNGYRLVKVILPEQKDFKAVTKKDEKHFFSRIEDPDEGVIIVFWLYAGKKDEITKGIYKKIAEHALTVNFKHENKGSSVLTAWIIRHFNHANIDIERNVAMYMSNYVGSDMTELKNEIDNCINYLRYENRNKVTADDINFICRKSEEAQIFDISSKALEGDFAFAMLAFNNLLTTSKNKDDTSMAVLALISKSVNDMCNVQTLVKAGEGVTIIAKKTGLYDFVVKKHLAVLNERARTYTGKGTYAEYASEICLEYDVLSKSSRTDKKELVKELIFKLCHP